VKANEEIAQKLVFLWKFEAADPKQPWGCEVKGNEEIPQKKLERSESISASALVGKRDLL
jgi:hypothetical protein